MLVLSVLCSAFTILAAHPASASSAVDKKISVQLKNVLLRDALDIIGAINGESFIYVSNDVLNESKVSINVRNERVGVILQQLLSPYELSYKVVYNRIVIRPGRRKMGLGSDDINENLVDAGLQPTIFVKGMVLTGTHQPLQGVTVSVKGTQRSTATGNEGTFELSAVEEDAILELCIAGYKTTEVAVSDFKAGAMPIQLEQVQTGILPVASPNSVVTSAALQVNNAAPAVYDQVSSHNDNKSIWLVEGVMFYAAPSYEPVPSCKRADSVRMKLIQGIVSREFGNILYQPAKYPAGFKHISFSLYCSSCEDVSDATAQNSGFVNAFAMRDPEQDFMQTMEIMLIDGRAGIERILDDISGVERDAAKERLRRKEAMVVQYFRDVWGMDFYQLQRHTKTTLYRQLR
ncbi:carboxypeptidase-like regulatory domain-containing protein [Chitinophaga pendula]|uniref:substrate import-associated zinc metallohydrolase lipoprotein n=1 Tax=Chitinophaga TaxID=79328 RepID=UPI0018DFCC82|nr:MULTISPECIES: substrate import-associated zinc metallohydrolase lipoprotein [Chitinophaga]UCJ08137.1 carboxypeptidase-like regulatory domain-containing protein [Chitinophaga pendula]